ncbi:hypothetical protein DFQ29_006251 [Apophysomyces sp. BC1021]|nr:hypothetical protein DFQ29_006251 [Apophysomyces sp. BC1021]
MTLETNVDLRDVIHLLQQQLEDMRIENLDLQRQIEESNQHGKQLDTDNDCLRKASWFSSTFSATQERLELQLYEQDQELDRLNKEVQQLTKSNKDVVKKLDAEYDAFEHERLQWLQRETELSSEIRMLNTSQYELKTPRKKSALCTLSKPAATSPTLVECLKGELEKQNLAILEQESQIRSQSHRIEQLQQEIANINQLNRSLMEDNEGYNMLLQEKTINGKFATNALLQPETVNEQSDRCATVPASDSEELNDAGDKSLNLAAELDLATNDGKEKTIRDLNKRVEILQDSNSAMRYYMNKLLMRLVDDKTFEEALNIDPPLTMERNSKSQHVPAQCFSSTLLSKVTSDRKTRRRTFSYWNTRMMAGKTIPPTMQFDDNVESHQDSIASGIGEELPIPSSSNSWSKILRRMSGLGWITSPQSEKDDSVHTLPDDDEPRSVKSRASSSSLRCINRAVALHED